MTLSDIHKYTSPYKYERVALGHARLFFKADKMQSTLLHGYLEGDGIFITGRVYFHATLKRCNSCRIAKRMSKLQHHSPEGALHFPKRINPIKILFSPSFRKNINQLCQTDQSLVYSLKLSLYRNQRNAQFFKCSFYSAHGNFNQILTLSQSKEKVIIEPKLPKWAIMLKDE